MLSQIKQNLTNMGQNQLASLFTNARIVSKGTQGLILAIKSDSAKDILEYRKELILRAIQQIDPNIKTVEFQLMLFDEPETFAELPPVTQESKTTLSGFTPLIDSVTDEFGLTTSAVYSVIWRHEQMSQKVCKCSLDTIAKLLNISYKTVQRKIKILRDAKLIKDMTPANVDVKKPRWYVTKKPKIKTEVTIGHFDL